MLIYYTGNVTSINISVTYIQGGSNVTGTDLSVNKPRLSRSCLNHLVRHNTMQRPVIDIDQGKKGKSTSLSGDLYDMVRLSMLIRMALMMRYIYRRKETIRNNASSILHSKQ